jgi:hypothetical protein
LPCRASAARDASSSFPGTKACRQSGQFAAVQPVSRLSPLLKQP